MTEAQLEALAGRLGVERLVDRAAASVPAAAAAAADGEAAVAGAVAASAAASAPAATASSHGAAGDAGEGWAEATFSPATRLFFYAARALQLGLLRCIDAGPSEIRSIARLHAMTFDHQDLPDGESVGENYRGLLANRIAYDIVRQHPDIVRPACAFAALACEWLGRVCQAGGRSAPSPFQSPPGAAVAWVPESLVATVIGVWDHVGNAQAYVEPRLSDSLLDVAEPSRHELRTTVHFLVALLASSSTYVRKPALRAQIGDLIYGLFVPANSRPAEDAAVSSRDRAEANPFAELACRLLESPSPFLLRELVPTLMALYGDVEHAGYYEKTLHRMRIAAALTYLWGFAAHRPAFYTLACADSAAAAAGAGGEASAGAGTLSPSRFDAFASGVLDTSSTMLSEALEALAAVRSQLAQLHSEAWASLSAVSTTRAPYAHSRKGEVRGVSRASRSLLSPQSARQERDDELARHTNTARSSLLLSNQTTGLLAQLTGHDAVCAALLKPALIDRLVAMLLKCLISLGECAAAVCLLLPVIWLPGTPCRWCGEGPSQRAGLCCRSQATASPRSAQLGLRVWSSRCLIPRGTTFDRCSYCAISSRPSCSWHATLPSSTPQPPAACIPTPSLSVSWRPCSASASCRQMAAQSLSPASDASLRRWRPRLWQ